MSKKKHVLEVEAMIDLDGSGDETGYYSRGHHDPAAFVEYVRKWLDRNISAEKVRHAYAHNTPAKFEGMNGAWNIRIVDEPRTGPGWYPITVVSL